MLSIEPVDRSSTTCTSWPAASRASDRCEPMKPAPPVIRTRMQVHLENAATAAVTSASAAGGERRMQRQRQDARAVTRSATGHVRGRPHGCGGLPRNGHGVVDQRLDARGAQVRLEAIAFGRRAPERDGTRVRRRTRAEPAPPLSCRLARYSAASRRRAAVRSARRGRRARSIAACSSSRRLFTPRSSWW